MLHGVIKDWLAVDGQVRARDDGTLNVIYSVAVDMYRNEAVDKILHDGVVDLDVTSRPTREQLGFPDDYDEASVVPEPGQHLRLRLRTPAGEAVLASDSLLSDSRDHSEPSVSVAAGTFADLADARSVITSAAPALATTSGGPGPSSTGPRETSATRTSSAARRPRTPVGCGSPPPPPWATPRQSATG